jgi:pyridoxamine 5'-phosphate oxidase
VSEPLALFRAWYEDAVAAGEFEPDAMALATSTPDGIPSVRFVLLKAIDERGVQFFTNYESRKGRELQENPRAALAVLWKQQPQRQVRLEGSVERLTAEESDAYFATRARGSRLGAWASAQSTEIADRDVLDTRLAEASERFPGDVPRPPYWGGFRLVPDVIELWQGRPDRLHDREQWRRTDAGWTARRLSP